MLIQSACVVVSSGASEVLPEHTGAPQSLNVSVQSGDHARHKIVRAL